MQIPPKIQPSTLRRYSRLRREHAGARMLYLATYKTNFSQIYDFWSRGGCFTEIPNGRTQFTAALCERVCVRDGGATACAGGVIRRNPVFFCSSAAYLFLSTFTDSKKEEIKKRERLWATFMTPRLNYTIAIKRRTLNHGPS